MHIYMADCLASRAGVPHGRAAAGFAVAPPRRGERMHQGAALCRFASFGPRLRQRAARRGPKGGFAKEAKLRTSALRTKKSGVGMEPSGSLLGQGFPSFQELVEAAGLRRHGPDRARAEVRPLAAKQDLASYLHSCTALIRDQLRRVAEARAERRARGRCQGRKDRLRGRSSGALTGAQVIPASGRCRGKLGSKQTLRPPVMPTSRSCSLPSS